MEKPGLTSFGDGSGSVLIGEDGWRVSISVDAAWGRAELSPEDAMALARDLVRRAHRLSVPKAAIPREWVIGDPGVCPYRFVYRISTPGMGMVTLKILDAETNEILLPRQQPVAVTKSIGFIEHQCQTLLEVFAQATGVKLG